MRKSRRNVPDPISPQNPVIAKDVIDGDRMQNHLEEKTAVEDLATPDRQTKSINQIKTKHFTANNDEHLGDES